MEELDIKQLKNIFYLMQPITGYLRILSLMGFSEKSLDLITAWADEEMRQIEKIENHYNKEIKPKELEALKEFKGEINGDDARIRYLQEQKEGIELSIIEANKHNKEMTESFYSPTENFTWLRLAIMSLWKVQEKTKQLKKINGDLYHLEHKDEVKTGQVTQEMIEKAKKYPFEQLVEIKKGFIPCPFHDEATASFYIKNNFGYCFGCHASTDTIGYIMQTQGLTFIEAVKRLQ